MMRPRLPRRPIIRLRASNCLRDPHCLGVYEFPDAYHSQFTSVTRGFHSAEGDARVRCHHLVDEHHPCFNFVDEALPLLFVIGPDARAQAEPHVVRQPDRLTRVFHPEDRSHRAKELLPIGGRVLWNIRQHRRCVEISWTLYWMSTG